MRLSVRIAVMFAAAAGLLAFAFWAGPPTCERGASSVRIGVMLLMGGC